MAILARISSSPIKGTALEHPPSVELTAAGIPGNRRFFLIDERGELFSGFDFGPLVRVRSSFDPKTETLTVAFPDGRVEASRVVDDGEVVLTDLDGRRGPATVVGGPFARAFTEFAGREVRLVRTVHDGDGPDVHHLTLVSSSSVRDLAAHAEFDGDLDARRFRINLELDGCDPYEEDSWDGRRVRVGTALVRVHGQIPRCVVTTQSPDTGLKDFDTLKHIAAYRPLIRGRRGIPFGMYAEVDEPGRASVGDDVAPLSD
jgi:uncharacterized protein YcbX